MPDAGALNRKVSTAKSAAWILATLLSVGTVTVGFGEARGARAVREFEPRIDTLEERTNAVERRVADAEQRDSDILQRLDRLLCHIEADQGIRQPISCAR